MPLLTVDVIASEIADDLRARLTRQGFTAQIAPDGRARISVRLRKPCQARDLMQRLNCYFEMRTIPALVKHSGGCAFLILLNAEEIEQMLEEERAAGHRRW